MDYPQEELVRDYQLFAQPMLALGKMTEEKLVGLLAAFFHLHYGSNPKVARDRMHVFLDFMAIIDANREELAKTGFLKVNSTTANVHIQNNLLRALHRLIIVDGKTGVSVEEIQEVAKRFAMRN